MTENQIGAADAALSQEQIDAILAAMRDFAAAVGELCERVVQAWANMAKAVAEALGPLLEWIGDIAVVVERVRRQQVIDYRAPRTLGRHNAMRTRQVRQWRWSPLYGRR